MRSAKQHALAAVKREIDTLTEVDAESARGLFDVVDALVASKPLANALVERGGDSDAKRKLVERVFGSQLSGGALRVLTTITSQKWESVEELIQVTQEAAIRALAHTTGNHDQLGTELDSFLDIVLANSELELALGTRLRGPETKLSLVDGMFGPRLHPDSMRVLHSVIRHPGGLRTRRIVGWAREAIADQANRQVANVTVAAPISEEQLARLRAGLAQRFGRDVAVNQVIDPSVIGGMRIEFGDVVIDDTVAARLYDLRLQLA